MSEPAMLNDRSKFALALLVLCAATALLALGRLDGKEWVSATTWTVAAYMLGQVGAVVAQGWTVQTIAKAKAAGVVVVILAALMLAPGARADLLEPGIFADGFDSTACPAIIAPDGIDRVRLTRSAIAYGAQHWPVRPAVDVTEWDNVWGYNDNLPGPPRAWPGVTGSAPTLMWFSRASYAAIHFHTPVEPAPGLASRWVNPSANNGPSLTMAISRVCGDFTAHLPTPGCLKQNVPSADWPLVYWQFAATGPLTACNLQPDTDYWVNVMQTDPASLIECAAPLCPAAVWRN